MANSVIVMGVAGCGKSSLGRALAFALHCPLIEGDEFHSAISNDKMRRGIALDDADRADWLDLLGEQLRAHPERVVLTCSALKRSYRDQLRLASPGLKFAFLRIDPVHAMRRVSARASAHLFPPSLVASQFEALESPEGEPGVLVLNAMAPLDQIVEAVVTWTTSTKDAA